MVLDIKISSKDIILVFGSTCCGKSQCTLNALNNLPCTIINADSAQVYKECPILSNTPSQQEQNIVPHKLFSFLSVLDPFSVGDWVELAHKTIYDCQKNTQIPIFVGGTGLYFNSLIYGISALPNCKICKQKAIDSYQNLGHLKFLEEVTKIDPKFTDQFQDKNRLIRAYSIYLHTKLRISDIQKDAPVLKNNYNFIKIFIMKDKDQLHKDIMIRIKQMLKKDVLDEVKQLMQLPNSEIYYKKFIGAKEFNLYLKNEISLDQAIEKISIRTRQYTKRQATWFNNKITDKIILTNQNNQCSVFRLVY